ncbi:nicotinate-nucleotide adenylyltransferase [bacterium]|nr:nicotinate-nucleotide adenylyltransferase [bacterium]
MPPRYAVFGGSFDPVHLGHLLLAELALEQLSLELVVFVPAAQGPHKEVAPRATDGQRLEMLRLALEDRAEFFSVDDCELRRGGVSYTIDTIRLLIERWGEQPHLLIGADNLNELLTWREIETLAKLVTFAYAPRPGSSVIEEKPLPNMRVRKIEMPLVAVSSAEIRHRAATGLRLRYQVPEAVRDYIKRHSLYR